MISKHVFIEKKIELPVNENIHFMWLLAGQKQGNKISERF